MIRLERAAQEPPELTDVRDGPKGPSGARAGGKLAKARTNYANGTLSGDDLVGYDVAKDALARQQSYKCAYCECREQPKRNDVEHFRPKGNVAAWMGQPVAGGYWWLTWTWENLLFACRNCNQSPAKLAKFPLKDPSRRLVPEQAPPGSEEPLLIDPYETDAAQHIAFRVLVVSHRRQWRPIGLTDEGRASIEILMLDRTDLLELYARHVEEEIEPEVSHLQALHQLGDEPLAREVSRVLRRKCAPTAVFTALSRDAIRHLLGDLAAQYGL